MARAYEGLDEPSLALEYHERATELQPDDRSAMLSFVRALAKSGQSGRADVLLSEWLAAHPDDIEVLSARADFMMQRERWSDAVGLLEGLDDRLPDNPSVLNNLAYARQRAGSPEALQTAQRAQTLAPQSPQVNDTLGWMLVEQGRPDEGLTYLREAVARNANDATLRYHLGFALHALGRDGEAVEELRAALRLSGDFSDRMNAQALLDRLR
jgi:Flp pilus assembly protein TadD